MLKYILGLIKNLFNPAVSLICKIDNRSVVDRYAKVYRHTQLLNSTIGRYSYLGPGSSLVYAKVGRFCSISANCTIGLAHHTLEFLSTSPIFTEAHNGTSHSWVSSDAANPYLEVEIGNDVWIGKGVMVMGGVKIGDGAVIGAGALVTKDVPPFVIVGGVPAKMIKYRFPEDVIATIESTQWWNMSDNKLKEAVATFQKKNISVDEIIKLHQSR